MSYSVCSKSLILFEGTALAFIPRISSAQDLWFWRCITFPVIFISIVFLRKSLGRSILTWYRIILIFQMILVNEQELPFVSSSVGTFTSFWSCFSIIRHLLDDLFHNLFLSTLPAKLTPHISINITWLLWVLLEIVWIPYLARTTISSLLRQSWCVNSSNLGLEFVHIDCRGWSQYLLTRIIENCLRILFPRRLFKRRLLRENLLILDYHRRF